jgi:hypothetical protein
MAEQSTSWWWPLKGISRRISKFATTTKLRRKNKKNRREKKYVTIIRPMTILFPHMASLSPGLRFDEI